MIRFPGNGGAHHIHNRQRLRSLPFRLPQGCQAVRRLPRLADDNYKFVFRQNRPPVAEFRCQIHPNRDPCQILQHVFCANPHMVRGAEGHDVNLADSRDLLLCQPYFRQPDFPVPNHGIQGVPDCAGLLMYFLHHKVFKAGSLRRFGIPGNLLRLLLDFVSVQVIECDGSFPQADKLQIADVIHLAGVIQNRRHVRCQEGFAIGGADDHGAVLAGGVNLLRVIPEHQGQRIGAPDAHHGMVDRVHRRVFVLPIVIVHKLHRHLGIRA